MWSIWNWIREFWPHFGWFWGNRDDTSSRTILLIGLDDAGKTTLTGRLTQDRLIQSQPTSQPSTHEIQIGSTTLAIIDVGGHIQARRLWKIYMFSSSRLIFMVDITNHERLPEVRDELHNLLKDDEIRQIPLLILANKIDRIELALSETEVIERLKLGPYLYTDNSRIHLCMCSVLRNEGYTEGLKWLINQKIETST
jgi:GTP-binding protein SAR1